MGGRSLGVVGEGGRSGAWLERCVFGRGPPMRGGKHSGQLEPRAGVKGHSGCREKIICSPTAHVPKGRRACLQNLRVVLKF